MPQVPCSIVLHTDFGGDVASIDYAPEVHKRGTLTATNGGQREKGESLGESRRSGGSVKNSIAHYKSCDQVYYFTC